jgi:hypothetical protein
MVSPEIVEVGTRDTIFLWGSLHHFTRQANLPSRSIQSINGQFHFEIIISFGGYFWPAPVASL